MKNKTNKFANQESWPQMIGKQVVKHSGKPFKGGDKVSVVTQYGINPNTQKEAFLIDGVWVDCFQVREALPSDL